MFSVQLRSRSRHHLPRLPRKIASNFFSRSIEFVYLCWQIDDRAALDEVCLMACCFPTGYGSVVNVGGVSDGSKCMVLGLGSVGLCAVMGCKDSGASVIIGVDVNPAKKDIGKCCFSCEYLQLA